MWPRAATIRKKGFFYADVSDLAEALIEVKFEEVRISGKEMEWRTKDNYLILGSLPGWKRMISN